MRFAGENRPSAGGGARVHLRKCARRALLRGVRRKVRASLPAAVVGTKAPYFEMLGKFFKVLTNNVAVTGANAGPVTILDLLEIVGPLPKGTTRERLAEQDATVVKTQAIEVSTESKPTLPDDVALAARYFNR
jgi:hypothetical protein